MAGTGPVTRSSTPNMRSIRVYDREKTSASRSMTYWCLNLIPVNRALKSPTMLVRSGGGIDVVVVDSSRCADTKAEY